MTLFNLPSANKFKDIGILGINERNIGFILKYNKRSSYPSVDNKVKTKELAIKAGISVPELYGVISIEHQFAQVMKDILLKHSDFVIKPSHGSGGDGVVVITDTYNDFFKKPDGFLIDYEELQYHVSNILNGIYSLGGHNDQAMIEYRIKSSKIFDKITYQGVPDVRIIVFKGYPVMAMLRLPTHQSRGRANLHQGAVGVGIDINSGYTSNGVWFNRRVKCHPDTKIPLESIKIPFWESCLLLAAQCYELTNLGYLGIDIAFDENLGPLILEMNARPGLTIQVANNVGLLKRLKFIEKISESLNIVDRVAISRKEFTVYE